MKNFSWSTFTRKIAVKSNISDIYHAWAKASEIEKWFLSNARYYDSNNNLINKNTPVEKGFRYEWSWYIYDVVEQGTITQANGTDFLQFTFSGQCLVDINLETSDEYVIVKLTQKNIPTDDESKQNIRLGCDSGWSFYLVNLKSVYENGPDLRNKNQDFKGMVNS